MSANEVLQWLAIAFLGVFVIGLTRQLGLFLMPRREQLAAHGPAIGKRISGALLPAPQREDVRNRLERSGGFAAYAVVYDQCASCEDLMRELLADDRLDRPVTVALAVGESEEFQRTAASAFDIVVIDPRGEIRARSDIRATPFVLVLDPELRVVHKQVTSSIQGALEEVTTMVGRTPASEARS